MKRWIFCYFLLPLSLLAIPMSQPWGKDSDLLAHKSRMPKQAKGISGKVATACIQFYQQTISPTNGPRSNFRPTSSRYMELAVKRYGFTKGILMGLDRLMRENDDAWVYRDIKIDQMSYKYDPAVIDKAKM